MMFYLDPVLDLDLVLDQDPAKTNATLAPWYKGEEEDKGKNEDKDEGVDNDAVEDKDEDECRSRVDPLVYNYVYCPGVEKKRNLTFASSNFCVFVFA
jgi:hypothetical protein